MGTVIAAGCRKMVSGDIGNLSNFCSAIFGDGDEQVKVILKMNSTGLYW